METLDLRRTAEQAEQRYRALVGLAERLSLVTDWSQLAECVAGVFGESARGVRVWAALSEGYEELARFPAEMSFPPGRGRDVRHAAEACEPVGDGESVLIGLQSVGRPLGVGEMLVSAPVDLELAAQIAPLVASRAALLLATGSGGFPRPPAPDEEAEVGAAIRAFAAQAKQVLDHDRLSAYLVTPDGRAVERFAVATSETLPDEGVIVPFSEFGLRHILVSNSPLVSASLGSDSRIVGREDRVIAQAGFHGLLSVPLRLEGKPFGVLNFVSRTPDFYSARDITVGQQIADQAAAFFDVLRRQRSTRIWTTHSVAEHERARLARELHDTLARALPEVADEARGLASGVMARDQPLGRRLEALANEVDLVVADTRRALVDLVPPALDSRPIEDVVRYELDRLEETAQVRVGFTLTGQTSTLSMGARRAIYRIVQEALSNIKRHAGAASVELDLTVDRDLRLRIEDDGQGFRPSNASTHAGLGLRFMDERARSLGGTLEVEAEPGRGTTLTFELPGVDTVAELAENGSPAAGELAPPTGVSLRIYVIEPQPLLLAGIVHVLRQEPDIRVVGAARGGSDAHGHIVRQRPDVVLLDIDHDPVAARSAVRDVALASPTSVLIATSESPAAAGDEFCALGAGGTVSKRLVGARFVDAIKHLAEGDERGAAGGGAAAARPGFVRLTTRERELLTLIASGRTNAEIAEALFLATKTIERNVTTLVGKLHARNRAHAAALAVASGLVAPETDDSSP